MINTLLTLRLTGRGDQKEEAKAVKAKAKEKEKAKESSRARTKSSLLKEERAKENGRARTILAKESPKEKAGLQKNNLAPLLPVSLSNKNPKCSQMPG